MMGFPSRIVETHSSLCACHSKLTKGGYLCSRCKTKICLLPVECPSCGLTLILSTHLARSYHHLFPLKNWIEVSWERAKQQKSTRCFACQTPFPPVPADMTDDHASGGVGREEKDDTTTTTTTTITLAMKAGTSTSPSSRYECTACGNHFCIDCDVWSHEIVHNCPGCQSGRGLQQQQQQQGQTQSGMVNGVDGEMERMDLG